MHALGEKTGFFRTRLMLEDGTSVYESYEGHILLRPYDLKEVAESHHRRMLGTGDTAFCPELNVVRPAWSFPRGMYKSRVVGFRFESEDEPLDGASAQIAGTSLQGEVRVTLF